MGTTGSLRKYGLFVPGLTIVNKHEFNISLFWVFWEYDFLGTDTTGYQRH